MSNLHDLLREIHGVKTQVMDLVKPLNYQAALTNSAMHYNFLWTDPWPEQAELNVTDAVNQRWL